MNNTTLVDIARGYIGQAEDPTQPENTDFMSEAFEDELEAVGWQKGWAWCMLFVRLCIKKDPVLFEKVKHLVNPSVLRTLQNLMGSGYSLSRTPVVGSICIMQNGQSAQGHTGIVSKVYPDGTFDLIEGNASAKAKTRQGDQVAEKRWKNDQTPRQKGLYIRGFIDLYQR